MPREVYRIDEIAAMFEVKSSTVRRWIKHGYYGNKLQATKVVIARPDNPAWTVTHEELVRFAKLLYGSKDE